MRHQILFSACLAAALQAMPMPVIAHVATITQASTPLSDNDEGEVIDICEPNTASNYQVWTTPIYIDQGKVVTIKTSRYTYLNGKVEGAGRINLYAGGERTYLGSNDKNAKNYHPDWYNFTGELHIYPYKEVEKNAGFYGLVWMSSKTFAPDNAAENAASGTINNVLLNSKVTLHEGATLACESGKRGLRIGHLDTETGSTLYGYIKNKAGNDGYYMVGADNTDATLAGKIAPMGGNQNVIVGIIKEGAGTYRITGNENLITGGLRILNGRVLISNDIAQAEANKLSGATGYQATANTKGVFVMEKGVIGGTGNIASSTDVYGTIHPGDTKTGKLTLKDFVKGNKLSLTLHPKSKIECEIAHKDDYSQLAVDGNLTFDNRKENFDTSNDNPLVYIQLTGNTNLQVGDAFTLITADNKIGEWNFDIRYPKQYTWKVEEQQTDDTHYALVATITSLQYGGQGDIKDDGGTEVVSPIDITLDDITAEKTNDTPLRTYAEGMQKYIGTCVSLYNNKINVDNESDSNTQLLKDQFNMVVCENEMKFDATEPTQGEFNYWNGDRLISFAQKHHMRVRGHALVWHSQVPQWLSIDGKKNDKNFSSQQLIDIMENHIENVAGHYKGKVAEWDVCNEVLDDDQSVVRTNPTSYKLRSASVWNYAGTDYIEKAFHKAHEVDPDAELILNDYGVEFKGNAKAEAFYNLAKHLKDSGVPITGVGLQCHLNVGSIDANKLKATFERFNAIGLKCVITELDLGMDDNEANRLQQAKDFYHIAKVAMEAPNCDELMVWGMNDSMTWRGGKHPLLFDENSKKKDAYYGMHIAMRKAPTTTGITSKQLKDENTQKIIATEYYNLQGQKVNHPSVKGVYILKQKLEDGSYKTHKIWVE